MNKLLSEFIGTFSLVFVGCGAIVVNSLYGSELGHLGISIAFGMIVMIMIYSVGNVSGAHLNPAVTIGFYFAKKIEILIASQYIISQIIGAITASLFLKLIFPLHKTIGTTLPVGNIWTSFIMEFILTFLLMFVILNISTGHKEKGIMAGITVGGVILIAALIGGPISGASLNPARSIGPALISGNLHNLWLYLTAPILGAIVATPIFKLIQKEKMEE